MLQLKPGQHLDLRAIQINASQARSNKEEEVRRRIGDKGQERGYKGNSYGIATWQRTRQALNVVAIDVVDEQLDYQLMRLSLRLRLRITRNRDTLLCFLNCNYVCERQTFWIREIALN